MKQLARFAWNLLPFFLVIGLTVGLDVHLVYPLAMVTAGMILSNRMPPSKLVRLARPHLSVDLSFLIWGISPVYWKAMQQVPALEIVTHRVEWSFFFLIAVTLVQKRWGEFKSVLRTPRTMLILVLTTLLVSINWLLYIWAVNAGYMLQASLGYYINPLVNVLLGMVFLKERLRRPQALAVLLACAAVIFRTVSYGELPWIALTLGFTFGFYGLIRKVGPVIQIEGLHVLILDDYFIVRA